MALPVTSPRRRPRVSLGRLAGFGAAGAVLLSAAVGCQQNSRFAAGDGGSPPSAYLSPSPDAAPLPKAAPRAVPIPPIPAVASVTPALVAGGKYPLGWFPPAQSRPWRYIVVHHSATGVGGAGRFDEEHRHKGWDELGYHFVVGNGTDTRDGLVEVGSRWPKQKQGAHAKTPDQRFNNYGIGICLVGNFEDGPPSPRQVRALETLLSFLMQRYRIPPENVIGHEDTGKSTACPGHYLEAMLPAIRRAAAREAADNYAAVLP